MLGWVGRDAVEVTRCFVGANSMFALARISHGLE
jgi:hypothetical protein